ncbi:MAG: NmrA family NAD(P)-binding protein [Pedobacter sp.]|nr:NmrA family NAD(P)-binding protein [Pedobacter sp.]
MKYEFAILGGTGHIGSALTEILLKEERSVLVIAHSDREKQKWTKLGAGFAVADVADSESLKKAFSQAERLFILNPPADPSTDAEQQELENIKSTGNALKGLNPEKIVMASTYGARDQTGIFDLGTLYQLEQLLKEQGSPLAIIRSAYYMSNFDMPAQMAIESGKLTTLLPSDFALPMVAPADIASYAAELLQNDDTGTFYLQAEKEYSANDAAEFLSDLTQTNITTNEIPESDWPAYMQENGFSTQSTESFIGMTKLTINEKFEAESPRIAPTPLSDYLREMIETLEEKENK